MQLSSVMDGSAGICVLRVVISLALVFCLCASSALAIVDDKCSACKAVAVSFHFPLSVRKLSGLKLWWNFARFFYFYCLLRGLPCDWCQIVDIADQFWFIRVEVLILGLRYSCWCAWLSVFFVSVCLKRRFSIDQILDSLLVVKKLHSRSC